MAKNKVLQFSAQGARQGRVVKNFTDRVAAANPEEVAVGTDPNID